MILFVVPLIALRVQSSAPPDLTWTLKTFKRLFAEELRPIASAAEDDKLSKEFIVFRRRVSTQSVRWIVSHSKYGALRSQLLIQLETRATDIGAPFLIATADHTQDYHLNSACAALLTAGVKAGGFRNQRSRIIEFARASITSRHFRNLAYQVELLGLLNDRGSVGLLRDLAKDRITSSEVDEVLDALDSFNTPESRKALEQLSSVCRRIAEEADARLARLETEKKK